MKVIHVRNAHHGLSEGIHLLREYGKIRDSRNGPVLVSPEPVTTVYDCPDERVVFWPQRDANPFLHLYESFWMLAGMNHVSSLARYAKQFMEYTDDGLTLHGAYGFRWRRFFTMDQLDVIVKRLKEDPHDRRCVLQMWEANVDLGSASKDVPCNLMVTFQVNTDYRLEMTVFNRSNDIIWGLYGANAVHFSMLHDYMACRIGIPIGRYTHVSVNFHAYTKVLDKMKPIPVDQGAFGRITCPYELGNVYPVRFFGNHVDASIELVLRQEPFDQINTTGLPHFAKIALIMFHAHHIGVVMKDLEKAISLLRDHQEVEPDADWIIAGMQWLNRRLERRILRAAAEGETLGEA